MRIRAPLNKISLLLCGVVLFLSSGSTGTDAYQEAYATGIERLARHLEQLAHTAASADLGRAPDRERLREAIHSGRQRMKAVDIWLRYLEPNAQRLINGPLPVEWETEVFEKHEPPYRRKGAGLMLAETYLDEPGATSDSLHALLRVAAEAARACLADSVRASISEPDHFLLCNRLHLLNLAAIYTTGFDCPDTARVIVELADMIDSVDQLLDLFAATWPDQVLPDAYRRGYSAMLRSVREQGTSFGTFDRYGFIREHVGPLFAQLQSVIRERRPRMTGYTDYALNNDATGIFSKDLYTGQITKGVFRRTDDPSMLSLLDSLGNLLFFDPILSGNGQRSCASCHRPDMCFTDTTRATAIAFDHQGALARNAPSLVNAPFNHLLMQDGLHIDAQGQALAVITEPHEMGGQEQEVLARVLSCPDYERGFNRLLRATPQFRKVDMQHVVSAITYHYASYSAGLSPFDRAMRGEGDLPPEAIRGFDLFMGRAQCGTCHFPPHFNGVKPPYIGSEFEVLGTPADTAYMALSNDTGRYRVLQAPEMHRAFRTGTLKNIARTAPYMHNGVFKDLRAVIAHYDRGGGAGMGLPVPNQTLSADSLHLSAVDVADLEAFLNALNEDIPAVRIPKNLPRSRNKRWNDRTVGGTY